MSDADQRLVVSIESDQQAARKTAETLRAHQRDVQDTIKGYRQLAEQGEKLRNIGTVAAGAGIAILAPLIASANEYAKRYGQLESQSRGFLAAQQRQADATASLGRTAAQALLPVMNQTAAFMEKVSAFAASHPELVKSAINVGAGLAAGGGALVAAGTAIQTIARSAELLKTAFSENGLLKSIGTTAVGLGALAVGAKAGEAIIREYGKSTGNAALANYQLSDALKTARTLVAAGAITFAQAFADTKMTIGRIGDIIEGIGTLLKVKFESIVDSVATAFRKLGIQLEGFFTDLWNNTIAKLPGQNTIQGRSTEDRLKAEDESFSERSFRRGVALQNEGERLAGNEATRQSQYAADQANIKKIADFAVQFANTGSLGPLVDGIANNVKDKLSGVLSGIQRLGSGAPVGLTTGGVSLPPEAVRAYMDLRKAQIASDKQYAEERAKVIADADKKIQEAATTLSEFRVQQAEAERDLQQKFQDEDKAELAKFLANENQIAAQARLKRLEDDRAHELRLKNLASLRDVAGFVHEQESYRLQTQNEDEQAAAEKQQRADQYAVTKKERDDQNAKELASLQKQGREKEQEYIQAIQKARQAKDDQLRLLQQKHNQENQLLLTHFAEQLAGLNQNIANLNSIQATGFANAEIAAQNFVNRNLNILQGLYGASIGVGTIGGTGSNYSNANIQEALQQFAGTPAPISQATTDFANSIFSHMPSFASGIKRIPHDMIVRVHEGETITRGVDGGGDRPIQITVHNTIGNLVTDTDLKRVERSIYKGVADGIAKGDLMAAQ